LQAARDAEAQGATHLGLGALNKAVFLNNGGKDLVPFLHAGCRVKLVHGNALTAAVVYSRIRQRVNPNDEIMFTGATSTVGTPVVLRLLQDGYRLRILTRSVDRFNRLRRLAGSMGDSLVRVESYEEGAACRTWVLGSALTKPVSRVAQRGTTFFEFAVPRTRVDYLKPFAVIAAGSVNFSSRTCDLTFCHDRGNKAVPACLAATIIHGLEGFSEHEVGDVDVSRLDHWLELAAKHGFQF